MSSLPTSPQPQWADMAPAPSPSHFKRGANFSWKNIFDPRVSRTRKFSLGSAASSRESVLMPAFPAKNSVAEETDQDLARQKYFKMDATKVLKDDLNLPAPKNRDELGKNRKHHHDKIPKKQLLISLVILVVVVAAIGSAIALSGNDKEQDKQATPPVFEITLAEADALCEQLNADGGRLAICMNPDEFFICDGELADNVPFLNEVDVSSCSGQQSCFCDPLSLTSTSNPCSVQENRNLCT